MSYLVSAVCEWLLLITFIVFFLTLREEAKDFCFSMTITLKDDESAARSEETTKIKKEEVDVSEECDEKVEEQQ